MTETHVPTDGGRDPVPGVDLIATGYARHERHDSPATARLRRKAGAHNPEHDAEADRLKTTIGDALPPTVRIALGYHESAREAARKLDDQED